LPQLEYWNNGILERWVERAKNNKCVVSTFDTHYCGWHKPISLRDNGGPEKLRKLQISGTLTLRRNMPISGGNRECIPLDSFHGNGP